MNRLLAISTVILVAMGADSQSLHSTNSVPISSSILNSKELKVLEKSSLDVWGLSQEEWDRHQELLLGIRGRLSTSTISPVEVLGIHARTEAERMRYARMWAHMMLEDANRVLLFQRAYDQAMQEISEDLRLIDEQRLPAREDHTEVLKADDRVLMFVSVNCKKCEVIFDRVVQLLPEIEGLDVYFVDSDPNLESKIRTWAQNLSISPRYVQDGTITLNIDRGTLEQLAPRVTTVPFLMLMRKNKAEQFPADWLP